MLILIKLKKNFKKYIKYRFYVNILKNIMLKKYFLMKKYVIQIFLYKKL